MALGSFSYSLYLTNNAFIPFLSIGIPVTLGALQRAPLNILAVIGSAIALYYGLERPMISVGRRFAKPVTPGRPYIAPRSRMVTPGPMPNVVPS